MKTFIKSSYLSFKLKMTHNKKSNSEHNKDNLRKKDSSSTSLQNEQFLQKRHYIPFITKNILQDYQMEFLPENSLTYLEFTRLTNHSAYKRIHHMNL